MGGLRPARRMGSLRHLDGNALTPALVLAAMMQLASTEPVTAPWASTYATTAAQISEAAPDDEIARILVAIGWCESRFNPDALHPVDHAAGVWQIVPHWGAPSAATAVRLVVESQRVCRNARPNERLAWYAKGGAGCDPRGYVISRHRMALARSLQ